MKKAIILDGHTINPGDLDWTLLTELADFTIYDRTSFSTNDTQLIIERSKDAEIILTNKTPIQREVIDELPNLKYIGVLATGYNVVDIQAAKERNIVVTNIPTYGTNTVAQTTFSLLLELTNHVGLHHDAVKQGEWTNNQDWCFWKKPLIELSGKTIGIIGYGRIGQATSKIAQAFGMNVIANKRTPNKDLETSQMKFASLDELYANSDVISLHCPLTEENKGMINKASIRKMKNGVLMINTARGALINETDLAKALNNGKVGGAAVDVDSSEPINENNPLLHAKNCIITPHIAWATKEARQRLLEQAVDNLNAFLEGNSKNRLNC
ncbi:D-2-hydroxyacid dehydrogenase [Paucisalibacillus sp. EB02]|uniref:D-2-hydroxyacid dehydrogenase n=1 Tax=Paucisalibacillus sp. EB02 TaxID=1347087 RepID=UPI0005AA2B7A|nr:D-2-hydroxyacid dehydrogenase [Paucisalibacillus sp. EB02]